MDTKDQELLRQWFESGKETLAAQVQTETVDAEKRTIDVVFFTGVEVPRYDWQRDEPYLLRFDPAGADLSLLNNGAPLCDTHMIWSLQRQLGRVEKAWTEGKIHKATVRFSKREEVQGVWMDVQDKIVTKLSMGVHFLEIEKKPQKNDEMLVKIATKWRPFELSFVPLPADFGTTTLARADRDGRATSKPAPAMAAGALARRLDYLKLRG